MKTMILFFFLSANFARAQVWPQIVREGTDATIKAEDISDIQSWEGKSKETLDNGQKEIEKLDTAQKRSAYATLLGDVVKASGNRENELLMRVTLNRALTMNEVLIANSKRSGRQDSLARRIFRDSIKVALRVYDVDNEFLNNTKAGQNEVAFNLPFASVGIKSAEYFAKQSMLAPSHQANYVMLVETLGWIFRDLNRDTGRQKYKAILDRISEFEDQVVAKSKPETPSDYLRLETKIKGFLDDQIEMAKQIPAPNTATVVFVEPQMEEKIVVRSTNCGLSGDVQSRESDCSMTYRPGSNYWNLVSRKVSERENTFVFHRTLSDTYWLIRQFSDIAVDGHLTTDHAQSLDDVKRYCRSQNALGKSNWHLATDREAYEAVVAGLFQISDGVANPALAPSFSDAALWTDKICERGAYTGIFKKEVTSIRTYTYGSPGGLCDRPLLFTPDKDPKKFKTIFCTLGK